MTPVRNHKNQQTYHRIWWFWPYRSLYVFLENQWIVTVYFCIINLTGQCCRTRRYVLWGSSSDEEGIEINNDLYSPAGEFWNQPCISESNTRLYIFYHMHGSARILFALKWVNLIWSNMQLVKCLTPHSGNLTCYWTSPSSTHVGHVHPFSIAIHVSLTMISDVS